MTKLNIIETAEKAGEFTLLTKALKAADMVTTFKETETLTVFAPTDKAFAKLPKGAFDDLLKPENKEKLRVLLNYHIVRGNLMSDGIVDSTAAKTLLGQELHFKSVDGGYKVNDAKIVSPDLAASNGCIHAIDTVLMPQTSAQAAAK